MVVTTALPPEIPVQHRGRQKAGVLIGAGTEYLVGCQVTEPALGRIPSEPERRTTLALHLSNLALDAKAALFRSPKTRIPTVKMSTGFGGRTLRFLSEPSGWKMLFESPD